MASQTHPVEGAVRLDVQTPAQVPLNTPLDYTLKVTNVSEVMVSSVVGIAAVLLEVIDVHDPIEVGGQETYIITATNQGTSPDTTVQITCTLEPAQQYVSSSGVTTATVQGNTIRFAPLPTLRTKYGSFFLEVLRS